MKSQKIKENCTLHDSDRTVFLNEVFWFMQDSAVDYEWIYLVRLSNIHMRTDAKNLETTARTIHLPQKKATTIHIISVFRKEACSGSIPWSCSHSNPKMFDRVAWRRLQPKADNLITAVKNKKIVRCWHVTLILEHFCLHTTPSNPPEFFKWHFVGAQQPREQERLWIHVIPRHKILSK